MALLREPNALNYGGTGEAEQEVTIRLDRQDGLAHICSAWPARSRRLERLYGPPKRVMERDGKVTPVFWAVPLAAIRAGRARRGRPLTEAERCPARQDPPLTET